MSAAALAFRSITIAGRREWLLGRPHDGAPVVLILQPLFAEMNRCRALIAELMALLSAGGVSPWTLDPPGTGESERELAGTGWEDWRAAVAHAVDLLAPVATVALRGGVLLEPEIIAHRWRFAPVGGSALLRDLVRGRLAGAREQGDRVDSGGLHKRMAKEIVELAGYPIAPALSQPLAAATPASATARIVTLAGTAEPGDLAIEAPPPWRRAEPAPDHDLAEALARDILAWLPCAS